MKYMKKYISVFLRNRRSYITIFFNLSLNLLGFSQGIFNDIKDFALAPVQLPVNIARGNNVVQSLAGSFQPAGRIIQRGSNIFQHAQNVFTTLPASAIESTLGTNWRRGYEKLTMKERVQFELAMTGGRYLGGCLSGNQCNVYQLVAGPLAASLRDTYKIYIGYGKPLPPNIIQKLSGVIPLDILNSTRYIISSSPEFSVPGFLNFGSEAIGSGGHAVTIGNLIIFSRSLNLDNYSDREWLIHEIAHIEQYKQYNYNEPLEAIDGFSIEYVKNWQGLEQNAQNTARFRVNQLPW